jgi:hypothetical protein
VPQTEANRLLEKSKETDLKRQEQEVKNQIDMQQDSLAYNSEHLSKDQAPSALSNK